MKYRIWEQLLNEYTDHPTARMVDEIEANSFDEAYKIAKQRNPQLGAMRIDDHAGGGKTAIEYDK